MSFARTIGINLDIDDEAVMWCPYRARTDSASSRLPTFSPYGASAPLVAGSWWLIAESLSLLINRIHHYTIRLLLEGGLPGLNGLCGLGDGIELVVEGSDEHD